MQLSGLGYFISAQRLRHGPVVVVEVEVGVDWVGVVVVEVEDVVGVGDATVVVVEDVVVVVVDVVEVLVEDVVVEPNVDVVDGFTGSLVVGILKSDSTSTTSTSTVSPPLPSMQPAATKTRHNRASPFIDTN